MGAMDTPVLRTKRLHLRRYRPEDFESFAELLGSPTVLQHSSSPPLKRASAKKLFDKCFDIYRDGNFAVWCVLAGKERVGHAELKPRKGESGLEIVYFLKVDAWGKGYGTELVEKLVAHGLTRADRVFATVDPANDRSIRVLMKNGFRFEKDDEKDPLCRFYHRRKEWR